jgi:sugar O-acyltransferase (sialic acid O-acetyltransferase NeuD family)
MKRLALLGASGHGKVVADAALASGWESVVFFDDAWPALKSNGHWPVIGNTDTLLGCLKDFDGVVVAIGHCVTRLSKHRQLIQAGARMATIAHPQAIVGRNVQLGGGTVLMAGAIINIDSVIGEACIINTGATVDHDANLADGVHVCPGAHLAGDVRVGIGSWVGIGAVVRQSLSIGAGVTVGAGAVVVKPISDGMTVIGNPAALITS